MQLTVGNLISSIKKNRKIVLVIFFLSLIVYPVKYYFYENDTSNLIVIIDNLEELSGGNKIQSKITKLYKKKVILKDDFQENILCTLNENNNLECNLYNIKNNSLDKKKNNLVKELEGLYVATLESIRPYGKDIRDMMNIYENQRKITLEEVILYLDEEIVSKKYITIDFKLVKNKFSFLNFLSYLVLINSLVIGYMIITHPKLRL